jgi:hypothetical protein
MLSIKSISNDFRKWQIGLSLLIMARLCLSLCVLVLSLTAGLNTVSAESGPVDIAMVVSLDRSESIDQEEARAQITGLIYTLKHPRFLHAVQNGLHGRIAISALTWSSFTRHEVILPWMMISGREDAEAAAQWLGKFLDRETTMTHGKQTDVAFGLETARMQMQALPWRAGKRVINIVSDGISNTGHVAVVDRDKTWAQDIAINALIFAQGSAVRILRNYFRDNVIAGPSAFVQLARTDADFAAATLRKMVLEIAYLNAALISERDSDSN